MSSDPEFPKSTPPAAPRDATLLQVAGAVFWSFLGIRKSKAMQRDAVTVKPLPVIIVGVISAALLVLGLLLLVRFIIGHAQGS